MRARPWMALLAGLMLFGPGCIIAPLQPGYTECGDFIDDEPCQPGQFCVDSTFNECEPGCTSDVNCASNQVCVKEYGDQVGVCLNSCDSCDDEGPW